MSVFGKFVAEAIIFNGKNDDGSDLSPEERAEYLKKRYYDEIYGSGANIVEEVKKKKEMKKDKSKEKYTDDDRFVGRYDRRTKVIVYPSREEVH